jgi:hypothetical protein
MKQGLMRAFGFAIGGSLAFAVGAAATAGTTAAGPYYAMPSWDQQLPASTRFVVLSNWIDSNFPSGGAAVLDRETGLVWERSPTTTTFDWFLAQDRCNSLGLGNRMGWRLPTLQELASLMDKTVPPPGPTLPTGHPFQNVQQGPYWTATILSTPFVAVGFFEDAEVFGATNNNSFVVWCVRGAQGVNPQ